MQGYIRDANRSPHHSRLLRPLRILTHVSDGLRPPAEAITHEPAHAGDASDSLACLGSHSLAKGRGAAAKNMEGRQFFSHQIVLREINLFFFFFFKCGIKQRRRCLFCQSTHPQLEYAPCFQFQRIACLETFSSSSLLLLLQCSEWLVGPGQ